MNMVKQEAEGTIQKYEGNNVTFNSRMDASWEDPTMIKVPVAKEEKTGAEKCVAAGNFENT